MSGQPDRPYLRRIMEAKVARARTHIDTLKSSCEAMVLDAMTNMPIHCYYEHGRLNVAIRGEIAKGTSIQTALVLGDVVHNLRSALDQCATRLVLAAGNTPTKRTYFPVWTSPGKDGAHPDIAGGVTPEALAVVRRMQPYVASPGAPEGNWLWQLHDLWNEDKHRGILVAPLWFSAASLGPSPHGIDFEAHLEPHSPMPSGYAMNVVSDTPGVHAGGYLIFNVCFDESLTTGSLQAVKTMESLADKTAVALKGLLPHFSAD